MTGDVFLRNHHHVIRQTARKFAKEMLPESLVRAYEEERLALRRALPLLQERKLLRGKALREALNLCDAPPLDIYGQLGKLGFSGILIPEAYGGSELDTLSQVIVMEELSYAWPAFALMCLAVPSSLFGFPILTYGTETQKRTYLPGIAEAREFGAFALTESEAGSWAANQKTRAEKTARGTWILNGEKAFITNCTIARAIVVFARTEQKTEGTSRGISAFIAERKTPGISVTHWDKWGQHTAPFGAVSFLDCVMPTDSLLGKEGQGYEIAMRTLDSGRVLIAAQALGIARRAFDIALAYAKDRITFRKKLSEHQLIQKKIADMQIMLDEGRFFTYQAALAKDNGLPFQIEASKAKLVASECAVAIVRDAIQILGGYAYTIECPLMRFLNDAMALPIYEGASEIQIIKIARSLTG